MLSVLLSKTIHTINNNTRIRYYNESEKREEKQQNTKKPAKLPVKISSEQTERSQAVNNNSHPDVRESNSNEEREIERIVYKMYGKYSIKASYISCSIRVIKISRQYQTCSRSMHICNNNNSMRFSM